MMTGGMALLVALLVAAPATTGTPELAWKHRYEEDITDVLTRIAPAPDGGYVAAGYRSTSEKGDEFLLAQFDVNGTQTWSKMYGSQFDDRPYSLIWTDEGYMALGDILGPDGTANLILMKITTDGKLEWHRVYRGEQDDRGRAVIDTGDGYLLLGHSNSFNESYNLLAIKIDAKGTEQWNREYGGASDERAQAVIRARDGGFALLGTRVTREGQKDLWLVKTDAQGREMWNRTYGGRGEERAHDLAEADDGSLLLLGDSRSYGAGSYDGWLVKTDGIGVEQWNRTYGGRGEESARAILPAGDGGWLLGGYGTALLSYDVWLTRINEDGYMEWRQTYGDIGRDEFGLAFIGAPDGDVVAVGIDQSIRWNDWMTMKVSNATAPSQTLHPVARAGIDMAASTGELVTFDGEAADPDGGIASQRWDFDGDGIWDWTAGQNAEASHVYEEPGRYEAVFWVTDTDGLSAMDMRVVDVQGGEPSGGLDTAGIVAVLMMTVMVGTIGSLWLDRRIDIRTSLGNLGWRPLRRLRDMNTWMWYLLIATVLVVAMKWITSWLVKTPIIYWDEHIYGTVAYDIAHGRFTLLGRIASDIRTSAEIPVGYSYLLAPAHIVGWSMDATYQGMHLVNAVLSTLTALPVFLILRRYVSGKAAFFAGVLVAVFPTTLSYSYVLMTENAFYLLFLVSCLLVVTLFSREKTDGWFVVLALITGSSVGLLMAIRATGIAILPAFAGVVLFRILVERQCSSLRYAVALVPFVPAVVYLAWLGGSSPLGYGDLEIYLERFFFIFSSSDAFVRFLTLLANEFIYLALMSLFVFMGSAIFLVAYRRRVPREQRRTLSALAVYGGLSTLFLMVLSGVFFLNSPDPLYTRYVSPGLPIIVMLGIVGLSLFRRDNRGRAPLVLGGVTLALGVLVMLFFPTGGYEKLFNLDIRWVLATAGPGVSMFTFICGLLLLFPLLVYGLYKWRSGRALAIKEHRSMTFYPRLWHRLTQPSHLFMAGTVLVALLLAVPAIGMVVDESDETVQVGANEPARWLSAHAPRATVVMDGNELAHSGGGMGSNQWWYMYVGSHFWYPSGEIRVADVEELQHLLQDGADGADYVLSTHDLTARLQRVETFHMRLAVKMPRRADTVTWHLYRL